MDSKLNENIV